MKKHKIKITILTDEDDYVRSINQSTEATMATRMLAGLSLIEQAFDEVHKTTGRTLTEFLGDAINALNETNIKIDKEPKNA